MSAIKLMNFCSFNLNEEKKDEQKRIVTFNVNEVRMKTYNATRRRKMDKRELFLSALIALIIMFLPVFGTSAQSVEGPPKYGGTLTRAESQRPGAWDPAKPCCVELWGYHMERLAIGGIDEYGLRGTKQFSFIDQNAVAISAIVGQLAYRFELVNPSLIKIHVRKGVHFHNKPPVNGRELDAEDVAVSFNRMLEVPFIKTGLWAFVDTIKAVDKYTVEIKLNSYNINWKWLFGPGIFNEIAPRELRGEDDFIKNWENANGTGPFMLTDFVVDVSATWSRNPDYWGTTTIDGDEYQLPFVDTLEQFYIVDETTRLAALRTAKLDLDFMLSTEQKDNLQKTASDLKVFGSTWGGLIKMLAMRADNPEYPTHDRKVRKALWMAINYKDLHEKAWGGAKHRYYSLVPEGWAAEFVTPVDELPAELIEGYSYNPQKAKQLLAEAGYPNGFKATIDIRETEEEQDIGSLLAAYFKEIGVELELRVLDLGVHRSNILSKKHSMLGVQVRVDPPEASIDIASIKTANNYAGWSPPGYEELLEETLVETDPAKAIEQIKELNLMHALGFHENQLGVPMIHSIGWPWVKNWYGETQVGHILSTPILSRIWIDQELKKKMGH